MQLSRPNMSEKIILKCKDGEGSDPGIIWGIIQAFTCGKEEMN
jgi:hypothetical protein